jgi:hypothetical protein
MNHMRVLTMAMMPSDYQCLPVTVMMTLVTVILEPRVAPLSMRGTTEGVKAAAARPAWRSMR